MGLNNAGGAVISQLSKALSLSMEDSPRGEVGPGALPETRGWQDGTNTTEGALGEVVRVGIFNFFSSDGMHRSRGNKCHMQ